MKNFLLKLLVFLANFFIKVSGYKVTKLPTAKIGALIEAYLQFIYLNKSEKVIFINTEKISNNYIYEHVKKKIKVLNSNFLTHLYFLKQGNKNFPNHKYYLSFPKKKYINDLTQNKQNHLIKFSDQDHLKIKSILEEINFNQNFQSYKEFVTLNLRSANYHQDKNNTIRNNFDLESFNKTINFFKKKNTLIITNLITNDVPQNLSQKINLYNEKLLLNINNLNISVNKKELLQLYFFEKSKYVIGCNAGSNFIALLFNKKILLQNIAFPDYFYDHGNLCPILLPKKYFDLNKNEMIPYEKVFNDKIFRFKHNSELLSIGVKIIENSDDELLEANKEMTLLSENEIKNIKKKQVSFWRKFNSFYKVEMPDLIISKNFYEKNTNLF